LRTTSVLVISSICCKITCRRRHSGEDITFTVHLWSLLTLTFPMY
jgi:hypothetical protein